jgi:hypothetical protein
MRIVPKHKILAIGGKSQKNDSSLHTVYARQYFGSAMETTIVGSGLGLERASVLRPIGERFGIVVEFDLTTRSLR